MNSTLLMPPAQPPMSERTAVLGHRSSLMFAVFGLLALFSGCPEKGDTPEVLVQRGNLLRDDGRIDEARSSYRLAVEGYKGYLKDEPENAYVWYELANVYYELGEFEEAIEGYEKAMEYSAEYSESALAWFQLATSHFQLTHKDEALEAYNTAIRLDPQDAVAFNDRGWLMQTAFDDADAAMHDYSEAIRIDPQDPVPVVNRALLHKAAGDLQLALEDMNRAVAIDPEHAGNFHERAEIHYQMGQKAEAIEDFTLAIALDPEFVDAYVGRGVVRRELGLAADAEEDFGKARDLVPGLTIPAAGLVTPAPDTIRLPDVAVMDYLEHQGYSQLASAGEGVLRIRASRDGIPVVVFVAAQESAGSIRLGDSDLTAIRESDVPVDLVVVASNVSQVSPEVVKLIRDWTPAEADLRPLQYEVTIP